MVRVKKARHAIKHRRETLKRAKGFRHGGSTKERMANERLVHAGAYAFAHRRDKKNDFRRLWIVRIGAALRDRISYSKFIDALKKHNIGLDRKILADLAHNKPDTFKRIAEKVS